MKIELTKEKYKTLLIMAYCGEWMLNSYKTNKDLIQKQTNDLEQHLFSFAKSADLEKWIEYDKDMKMYFPTAEMEEDLQDFIDKYNQRQKII